VFIVERNHVTNPFVTNLITHSPGHRWAATMCCSCTTCLYLLCVFSSGICSVTSLQSKNNTHL